MHTKDALKDVPEKCTGKSANSRFQECFSRVHEILEHRVIKVKYRTADSAASTDTTNDGSNSQNF